MTALDQLLGESAPVATVRAQAARLLASAAGAARRLPPVLVLGETGTGKGLLAAALHRASARAAGPFVDVNCTAIPETLLEAELFGFERGAFTDARQGKTGLFQASSGGTIFLDEVGLMPLALQSKLLKVIEERSVRRLGSTRSEPLDVFVVAATSEDLEAAVQAGRFRADLYHRVAVVTLVLPPLRARGTDVLLLAGHFLARVCADYGLPRHVLTEDAKAAMLAYPWPGNVRELANVLERAVLLAGEPRLTAAGLGLPATTPAAGSPSPAARGAADAETARERALLLETLRATGWNFTRAAARLDVPRNTLRYRVERLGLLPGDAPVRRRGGRPPAPRRFAAPAPETSAVSPEGVAAPGASAPAPIEAPPHGRAPDERVREIRRVTLLQVRVALVDAGAVVWETSRAVDEIAGKVQSFGGRVEEIGVTEVLASFGVEPEEDALRRAAYAALAVRRFAARAWHDAGEAPRMNSVLHTETLTVMRTAGRSELDADALKVARPRLDALLAAAPAGAIVASEATGRLLARRFELAPLPPPHAAETGACEVIREGQPRWPRFVGRERELRLLMERFELAQAGQGQVVLIVGEPGIGKSRLLHEFCRRLGRRATWVEGQALAFGRAMPFHPVVDMLRRVFRIDEADSEAVIVEKIERGVRRLGPDASPALSFVRYLLSVDPGDPAVLTMEPRQRHAAVLTATRLLLERAAELRPHVLVLEDMHWCDTGTEDWIARLAEGIAAKRVLLVVTCRPGYRPPIGASSYFTTLALATLSAEESLQIAAGLLGVEELPPELRALVVDTAEGNPFFVEELVRSLAELHAVRWTGERLAVTGPIERLAVPDTIEEVLRARMHRLEPQLRDVLEMGAVIGRVVPFALLQAVTGHAEETLAAELRQLQAVEFVYESRVFPDLEHTFKHALTQDVAYAGVEPARRRALHARIVDAIIERYPDRLGDHVERLAYHARHGERWAEAVRFSREAGAKAFDRSANREAVASLEQALAALARLPESRQTQEAAVDIRLALRSALLQLGEIRKIAGYLREAEAIATAVDDRPRLAWVWAYMTIAHLFAGDPVEAQKVGELALALADEVGDIRLRATVRTPLAHACRERGDHRRAVALYREAIAWLMGDLVRERLGQGMPPALYARSMSATCLAELGAFAEAGALAAESAELAQALDFPFGLALARLALGHTALIRGRLADAVAAIDAALDLMATRGIPTWFPWAASIKGYALALSGDAAQGAPLLEQALQRAAALPFLVGHSQWVAWLAHALLVAGAGDRARASADDALLLSRRRGERGYEAWALYVAGEVEARDGSSEAMARAEGRYRDALAIAAELGMRPLVVRCHLGLGALGAATGSGWAREHRDAGRALLVELDMISPTGGPGEIPAASGQP